MGSLHLRMTVTLFLAIHSSIVVGCDKLPHNEDLTRPSYGSEDDGSAGKTIFNPTPVVLWHGYGHSYCSKDGILFLVTLIKRIIPLVYIKSLMIGADSSDDERNSQFMDGYKQVDMACKLIADDPKLRRGYHGVGISQGAQLLRAVAQRCPDPPIFILVSLGGQHQGIYGNGDPTIKFFLKHFAYWSIVQNHIFPAQYWHDPKNHQLYVRKSKFIAKINNESENHPEYKENLLKLKHLVLLKFERDEMVLPPESSWFGFYKKGQAKEIEPLLDSELYQKDRIGLKVLFETSRLHMIAYPGFHLEWDDDWFMDSIIKPWLTKKYWEDSDIISNE